MGFIVGKVGFSFEGGFVSLGFLFLDGGGSFVYIDVVLEAVVGYFCFYFLMVSAV